MSTLSTNLDLVSDVRALKFHLLSRRAQYSLDFITLTAAFVLAYLLRFDFSLPISEAILAAFQLPLVLSIQLAVLYLCGIYKFIWRYVGLSEAKK